ncbi:MAG: glycosyltransferase family 2 protein [Akkermansiaceae bacterium]|nr:glycosyltransferase family 2 protein [Akkermansiaceae bacterium]
MSPTSKQLRASVQSPCLLPHADEVLCITAVLTCHNRRDLTLHCLEHLHNQDLPDSVVLEVVLVDDGSTDGTGKAVHARFPNVVILQGDGSLFWCGGMRLGWQHAEKRQPDYLLLLNDDTELSPHALNDLLSIAPDQGSLAIAVGAVVDPESGEHVYGGRKRGAVGGLVPLASQPSVCDTFNGNCVLIPMAVRKSLNGFHPGYTHSFADFDYGLQATKRGIPVIQSAAAVGTCSPNSITNTWQDTNLSMFQRFKKLQSPKGMPWRDHLTYARRTQGARWPRHFIGPYFRILTGR